MAADPRHDGRAAMWTDPFDALPCGTLAFDDDGTVVAANAPLLAMLGYERGEVEGRHVERLLTVAGRIFYQTHLFPMLRLHGEAREIFLLLRRRDGGDVGAIANLVRRERDGAARSECVLIEVRERRKYEDALLRARREADEARAAADAHAAELEMANEQLVAQAEELEAQQQQLREQAAELERHGMALDRARAVAEAANRAKSDFLAVMSHELRTPLNAIGGYVELIELGIRGPVTDAQLADLRRIQLSQRHLLGLINEVLNYAKLETGRVRYDVAEVSLRDALAGAEALVAPQARAKDLVLTVGDVDPAVRVHADAEKLRQILVNLLSNALKFTAPGGFVTIGARARDGRVVVAVRDTGIGIPADKLDEIFDPFVQVRTDATRTYEGTGLGLAISRDLARGMGGDLTAASVVGMGSTFTLALPGG